MRARHFLIIAVAAAFAAPAGAQTIKKTGDEIHHVLKKTGNAVKQGAKDAGSAAHHTLKKAGNATKTTLGNATGIHKVGGSVGNAAQDVSKTGKHLARKAKHGIKKGKAAAHSDLTKAGKDAKSTVKP